MTHAGMVLVGQPDHRRTHLLQAALQRRGLPPARVIAYDALLADPRVARPFDHLVLDEARLHGGDLGLQIGFDQGREAFVGLGHLRRGLVHRALCPADHLLA